MNCGGPRVANLAQLTGEPRSERVWLLGQSPAAGVGRAGPRSARRR